MPPLLLFSYILFLLPNNFQRHPLKFNTANTSFFLIVCWFGVSAINFSVKISKNVLCKWDYFFVTGNIIALFHITPHKGKAPTKGAKQILMENSATVIFYRNMALGSTVFYGIFMSILHPEEVSLWIIILNLLAIGIHIGCYQIMQYISRPKYSDNLQLLDPGLDINMEGGMGEHIKDIVILVSITHILAVISNYFWILLLLLPLRAFWLIWTNFLAPWFFQEAPADTEQDEKKRKKLERKMKRNHFLQ